jgi:phosphoribosylpyrophosphate synthetase
MNVISVTWEEIRRYYTPLLRAFDDCIVLSISSGGTAIFNELKTGHPHISVNCRRPSSSSGLKKLFVKLARNLPEPFRNVLRFLEHKLLMSFESGRREVRFEESDIVRIKSYGKIVVLDDAIDTGATMKSVIDALRAAGWDGRILTVVFAWTNVRSLVRPDFWYKESVLVKFPWSHDL